MIGKVGELCYRKPVGTLMGAQNFNLSPKYFQTGRVIPLQMLHIFRQFSCRCWLNTQLSNAVYFMGGKMPNFQRYHLR